MSGLTESLKAAHLPRSPEGLEVVKPRRKFKIFPHVLGAVDATLVPIQTPTDKAVNNANFSGKRHCHGLKIQVVVDSDGRQSTLRIYSQGGVTTRFFSENLVFLSS